MKMTFSQSSRRFASLPDVFLQGENILESNDIEPPEITIARAEARARVRQRRNGSRLLRGTDRQFAEALHREADTLHYKGDYETALVLYHRAASLCPRDSSHGVAARRTAAAINALSHPSKALNGLLPKVRNGGQESAMVCPESAALRASRILTESSNPISVVPQILNFFDGRKDFWHNSKTRMPLTRVKLITGENNADTPTMRIKKMEAALSAGEATSALRIGSEILRNLSNYSTMEFESLNRYEATTHRLLAMAHTTLGRHDRAVASASRMTRAVLAVDIPLLITQALITLGKIHLTFGHLNAAAQAWESLVPFVSELVPRAWLFHEIGRCYLENGNSNKAIELATACIDTARAADSKKWTFHGRLLLGQTLAQTGRFTEAANALGNLTLTEQEAGDARTLAYVRELTEELIQASNCEKLSCKIQGQDEKLTENDFPESSTRFESPDSISSSNSNEDHKAEILSNGNSLCTEGSSLSLDPTSARTILGDKETWQFQISSAAGGDLDSFNGHQSSVTTNSWIDILAGPESISTGRTYAVSSPLFQSF